MRSVVVVLFVSSLLLSSVLAQDKDNFPSDSHDTKFWTTNYGAPVSDNLHSLTVGERGPTLLQDYTFIEKLAHFARERIPERVVHASGVSAYGYFEVEKDVSQWTFADFLQPHKITYVQTALQCFVRSMWQQ